MKTTATLTLLMLATVAGCEGPAVTETAESGEIGREIVETIAAALGEDPSKLRILAESWDELDPELAAEIEEYAEASGIAVDCSHDPPVDSRYCLRDGRTGAEVLRLWPSYFTPTDGISFKYRRRKDDGTASAAAEIYEMEVERLETGGWRIGEPVYWVESW